MENSRKKPKIGLALGSGASRGWSHIGVIKALAREGIEPDIVCGASVGAMVGAAYLAGRLESLEKWVLESTRTDVLKFFKIGFSQAGLVDVGRFERFLKEQVAGKDAKIESLPREFAAIATDLDNGREVWFRKGNLVQALRASMALPGLFPAVFHDHRWLVDGGLVNPVPVSTCRAIGADIVIAVNLNSDIVGKARRGVKKIEEPDEPDSDETSGVLEVLKQATRDYSNAIFRNNEKKASPPGMFFSVANAISIAQDRITRSRLAGDPPEVVLNPRLAHIGMLEFHHAPDAIEEGERCVASALPDIRRLLRDG